MTEKSRSPRTEKLENCPVCGTGGSAHFLTAPDRLHGTPGDFSYEKCVSCETVFQNPMVVKEDLHLCYPSDYKPYDYDPEMPELNFEASANLGVLGNARHFVRKAIAREVWHEPLPGIAGLVGRVFARSRSFRERAFYGIVPADCLPAARGKYFALEVGCGAGWMLKRLRHVGWQVEGIEWDETAAEIAAARAGVKVWSGDFDEIELPKEKYDLIYLNHVFEHFTNPLMLLERLYELLAPKGKLMLIYPNPQSFDSRWFGKNWFHWDPPRHLNFLTAASLTDYARRRGFVNIKINSIVMKYSWTGSKAYKLGLHPFTSQPALSFTEQLGLLLQRFMMRFDAKKGSELMVVLEKP